MRFRLLSFLVVLIFFFFSSRRRHTRWPRDWSSDVCSSDLTVDALANANEVAPESLFTAFARVGRARSCEPSIEFILDELGIFEQAHDFGPHDFVQQILTHWPIVANGARKPPPAVGAETSIIVDC